MRERENTSVQEEGQVGSDHAPSESGDAGNERAETAHRRTLWRLLQIGAIVVVGLLLALLGWQLLNQGGGAALVAAVEAGERPKAPDFELPRLDAPGTLRLSSLRGSAVVINFWASWCDPCKDEAPELQSAWKRYRGERLVILGLDAQDFRTDARRFMERFGLTYPNVHDGQGSTLNRYGVTGFPETWFVDTEGRIVKRIEGPVTAESLERGIRTLFGEG